MLSEFSTCMFVCHPKLNKPEKVISVVLIAHTNIIVNQWKIKIFYLLVSKGNVFVFFHSGGCQRNLETRYSVHTLRLLPPLRPQSRLEHISKRNQGRTRATHWDTWKLCNDMFCSLRATKQLLEPSFKIFFMPPSLR